MCLHSHHWSPNNVMDVIWTASAVKRIQFDVLNSILIRQDSRPAGALIKMQMGPLMHLLFLLQILLQMSTEIELMCLVKHHRGPMRRL